MPIVRMLDKDVHIKKDPDFCLRNAKVCFEDSAVDVRHCHMLDPNTDIRFSLSNFAAPRSTSTRAYSQYVLLTK